MRVLLLIACLNLAWTSAWADGGLETHRVTEGVYAIVGERGNRSPQNLGNNATFGFVVTADGVVLIDAGGSERGARAIEQQVRTITDQPIVAVINTGGQDHRWLGNDYFRRQGARVIASQAAVADQRQRAQDQLIMLNSLVGAEPMQGTRAAHADETFTAQLDFVLGGTRFEIRHSGPAHTPGDSFVWLPERRVVFTGDIVYIERMLGVLAYSSSRDWIDVFDAMAALDPEYVVPGHGSVTTLERARRDTRDYLVFLRTAVAEFIDEGRDLSEIGTIDQSAWTYLSNHELLAGRNAQQVFVEMEWE